MAKITIVGRREWNNKDSNTGEEVSGLSYIGYLKGDKAIQFTSLEEYVVHEGEISYDENLAIEVKLKTTLFAGKVKYKDLESYPDTK